MKIGDAVVSISVFYLGGLRLEYRSEILILEKKTV
jgi:hypothetical protein